MCVCVCARIQCVENFGSWLPSMTRLSTPSSEMLASLMTPPLEPSLSIAKDSAETTQAVKTGQTWLFDDHQPLPHPPMASSSSVYLQQ